MFASGSRSVRNWVGTPGRRVSWAIWPSTQISPEPGDPLADLHRDDPDRDGRLRPRSRAGPRGVRSPSVSRDGACRSADVAGAVGAAVARSWRSWRPLGRRSRPGCRLRGHRARSACLARGRGRPGRGGRRRRSNAAGASSGTGRVRPSPARRRWPTAGGSSVGWRAVEHFVTPCGQPGVPLLGAQRHLQRGADGEHRQLDGRDRAACGPRRRRWRRVRRRRGRGLAGGMAPACRIAACRTMTGDPYHRVMAALPTPSRAHRQAGAAGQATRLLRRRRPGRADGRARARPLRRAGLRAQADRAQPACRASRSRSAARSSSRRTTRCPRARSWCSRPTASRRRSTSRPPARSLRTIDATCPLVTKVHHEVAPLRQGRLRHPADRPRGPRGGRRHQRRGARSTSRSSTGPRMSPTSRCATRAGRAGSRRPRCRSTRRCRPSTRCASGSRCCSRRRPTTSATPPRTGRPRSRRSPPQVDLFLVVGSANSSNSVRMVEVALAAGAPAAYLVENADDDRPGLARRGADRRALLGRVGAEVLVRERAATGWPSAATPTSRRSPTPRSG